ncbi:MAG: tRNA guanosine(15) transglycosylase TgtA [Thaumarchaeota archaeon]|nr:tRNA guanosine(15) transglycosylase TgtA [Nitrososphaerota archaeon]
MGFSFEVKESDLLGRLGTMRVRGKTLQTPCLLPVIHPVSQAVPPSELRAIGFEGLMTNSYILSSRRRDEAVSEGIHRLLGYDGVLMTDSGGYQVLQYGDLDVDYRQVASFQADIGSDFGVTLDRPTGYPQTSSVAKQTMEYSRKNAIATLAEFGNRETVWVGPVQGGLYLDQVKRSASSMVKAGFEFLALGSPVQVMQNYMFADLVRMILAVRKAVPYSVPIHLFGAGHPLTMALAVALGCDTFDSASYILFARKGKYMSRSGVTSLESMKFLSCSCPVCAKSTVKGLLELDHAEKTRMLALHNLYVLKDEVEACKEAIAQGRLWDLVEERSMAHPRLREAFEEMTKHVELLGEGTPAVKDRGLFIRSREDLIRPEILIARRRLGGALQRGSERATVSVASEEKGRLPPSRGRKDRRSADSYRIHPVLGLHPAELEFVYPFSQSVVAEGIEENLNPRGVSASLRKMGYRSVSFIDKGQRKGKVRSTRSLRGASPSARSS